MMVIMPGAAVWSLGVRPVDDSDMLEGKDVVTEILISNMDLSEGCEADV